MVHVSGPVSTLPGKKFSVIDGSKCDEHPEVYAVAMIQGETDSFGAEYIHMCQQCLDDFYNNQSECDSESSCDWCGKTAKLKPYRDSDEGSFGRVYHVCSDCILKDQESLLKEYEELTD